MNAKQTIRDLDNLSWHSLPRDNGQIIDVTYAVDETHLYRLSHDQSDGGVCISRAALDRDSDTEFEPQNGVLPDVDGDYEIVVVAPGRDLIPAILRMAEVLDDHGDRYTGGAVWGTAAEWVHAGFDVASADDWMDAGFWDAESAATVRDLGITACQARERADVLAEADADAYTDGDPIYSICNGDTEASVLVDTSVMA